MLCGRRSLSALWHVNASCSLCSPRLSPGSHLPPTTDVALFLERADYEVRSRDAGGKNSSSRCIWNRELSSLSPQISRLVISYPHLAISDSSTVLCESQNIQVHVVLSSSSQAKAETFAVPLQVHRVELRLLGQKER